MTARSRILARCLVDTCTILQQVPIVFVPSNDSTSTSNKESFRERNTHRVLDDGRNRTTINQNEAKTKNPRFAYLNI